MNKNLRAGWPIRKLGFPAFLIPFIVALSACAPIHSVEYEIDSPVGHGTNWDCDGSSGATTALAFRQAGVRFVFGVSDESPPQPGINIWVPENSSVLFDWTKITILSDQGNVLSAPPRSIYFRNLKDNTRKEFGREKIDLDAGDKSGVIYQPVLKLPHGGLPDSFFIVVPERTIGNKVFPEFKVHFKKTTGWSLSAINC